MRRPTRARPAVSRRAYLGLLRCGLTPTEARQVVREARGRARALLARAVGS